jgi:hypothetical protein
LNWEAVGAVAEAIGAIGVIVTLMYLAVQIRSNTQTVRATAFQEMDEGIRALNLVLAQDAELSRIWTNGLSDFDSLRGEEKVRFAGIANVFLRCIQNAEFQFQQGTLDGAVQASWLQQLRMVCQMPGFGTWWNRNEVYLYLPDFQELVERFISKHPRPAA